MGMVKNKCTRSRDIEANNVFTIVIQLINILPIWQN